MSNLTPKVFKNESKSRDALVNEELFIDSPSDFICRMIAFELRTIPVWATLFKGGIDHYKRMDYSMRGLPAIRIYTENYRKDFDSWFVDGDIILDVILPSSLRRHELEEVPGQIANALLQQFRRPKFFGILRESIPGLNELGKEFTVDTALGFQIKENVVPLTQINANFRIDLREWDKYLEETCRTKDEPFEKVLGNLEKIVSTLCAVDDDLDVENPEVIIEDVIKINKGE